MIHREPLTTEIFGKEFYLAHGDGLGDPDKKFKMLRAMFRSRTLQTLFSALHPRWSMELGLNWAKHSRLKRIDGKEPAYMGENNEYLVLYTKEYLKSYNPHCQTVNHHTITTHETFKTEKHDCRMPARSRSIAGMGTIRRPDTCHPH